VGLGNGYWITGRMERNGELRYMMNGHYDIDFLSSSLSINRDIPVLSPPPRLNAQTNERWTALLVQAIILLFFFSSSSR
jgi:hypothetical protein